MRTRPGCSGSLPATGWSSSSPTRRATPTCSARVMSWSRRNKTLCVSRSALISANSASSRAASPRLTPDSSAPMAQVRGSTLIELCSTPGRTKAGASGCARVVWFMQMSPMEKWVEESAGVRGPLSAGKNRELNDEDRGADRLTRLEIAVGPGRVFQRVALLDFDLDATGGDVVEEFARERVTLGRIADVVGERRARHIERALLRELRHGQRWHRTRGGAEAHQQATALERIERAFEGGLADAVENDRNAGAVGELADAGGNVLVTVVDDVVAAIGAGDGGLLLARHGPDHPEAEEFRPLAHDQTDAARRGVQDRKSTRLNSSHHSISYADFCLKKKKIVNLEYRTSRPGWDGCPSILQIGRA